MNKIFYVSGLPRAGSTLLMNLLGQNPNHHVTPTSGVIELFITIQRNWPQFIEFRAEGLENVKPRIPSTMRGVLEGYFDEPLSKGKIVFDKSRGWLQYIEDLEQAFGEEVKVLVPIRDLRAIVASFEKLYRKREIDWRYPVGDAYFSSQTTVDRCELLLQPRGVVGVAVNRVRDAISRLSNRLVLVPFQTLTAEPVGTMSAIHDVLGFEQFDYDTKNVKQITKEDDTWHGMHLHVIRPKVEPTSTTPWEGILPDRYAQTLAERYADINQLCVPPGTKKAIVEESKPKPTVMKPRQERKATSKKNKGKTKVISPSDDDGE